MTRHQSSAGAKNHRALIIANGVLPLPHVLRRFLSSPDMIICADGGANSARKLRIVPHIILGDFDSITPSTRKYFRKIPQLYYADQESTDLEKALHFCVQCRITSADIVGASGTRIDHTLGALGCFRKYGSQIDLRLIDSSGVLQLVRRNMRLQTHPGETISLIPLDRCRGITTSHLKFALDNDDLETGVRNGISNEATASNVTIRVKSGTLLLYRFHRREG